MALTNWNDILNKPKGIDEVPEIVLTVEQLSASVLSIEEKIENSEYEGITAVGNYIIPRVSHADRYGNVISISIAFSNAADYDQIPAGGYTKIGTLSEKYRPVRDIFKYFNIIENDQSSPIYQKAKFDSVIKIETNGDISIYNYTAAQRISLRADFTYIVGYTLSETRQAKKTTKKK